MHTDALKLPLRRWPNLAQINAAHPTWAWNAWFYAGVTALCLLAMPFDARTLNDVSVWSKPFKFCLSISVYFATIAWFSNLLSARFWSSAHGRALTSTPIVFAALEIAYIIFQAARGEHSHFNLDTPFHAAMYSLMGFGAVVLVTVLAWMGVLIARAHSLREPWVLAVVLGLLVTFALGGGFGGYLGGQGGHWVNAPATDANGLWLVNWSREGGDLRVAHFFGMHAMQVLPMLALVLGAAARRSHIILAALLYGGLTTWTFVQAVNGQPLLAASLGGA